MKIIFDFDHTLFSAKKLYLTFQKAFEKLGVEEKLFQETFEKSKGKGRDYKPSRQFQLIIKKRPQTPLRKLKKLFDKILTKAENFLYPDVLPVLKKLAKRKIEMVILSYGEDHFQPLKIKKSKIGKFFKKIFITKDISKVSDLRQIFKNREKIIFVEDNPDALFKSKRAFPEVITVRINRGEGKYAKLPNSSQVDFSIKNLKELDKILSKISKD